MMTGNFSVKPSIKDLSYTLTDTVHKYEAMIKAKDECIKDLSKPCDCQIGTKKVTLRLDMM